MAKEKILVVDDEYDIRELIVKYISREGMTAVHADGGNEALQMIKKDEYDLIILDIMMDDLDGFEVLKCIRQKNIHTPVMFLSARQEDHDKILGLGLGADDYVTKPFSPAELTARVKAHIRRNRERAFIASEPEPIIQGLLSLNVKSYTLLKSGIPIELSATELKLLKFFMENPEQVFTKAQIYRNVWGDDFYDNNSVMVYIRHLREKIEDNPKEPLILQTVWGIGYKFSSNHSC